MMKVISGNRVPIKMWLNDIEDSALEQAIDLASLPFAFKHVAIMPDAHTGMGMPIGGVLATKGVIVPNAVGVDIGCGMCAVKTNIKAEEIPSDVLKKNIMSGIRDVIPLGFDHHNKPEDENLMPKDYDLNTIPVIKNLYKSALLQLGTLGGGNHFIELQKSQNGDVWIMLHSGSRNFGFQIAKHYDIIAQKLDEQWYSESLPGLAFMPIECKEAKEYFASMKYCVDFAFANRKLMMERIKDVLLKHLPQIDFEPMINIAHNYAAWENHFDQNVIVHRKGATRAYKGEIGIIPGSQGTHSFIVEGLGNPESFMSCSHGAGRTMSRTAAIKNLNLQDEIDKLNALGIVHAIRNQNDLEEAASAYKDIQTVIANESDLVKPIVELSPLAVIKG